MAELLNRSTSHSLLERIRLGPDPGDWRRFIQIYAPMLVIWARKLNVRSADINDIVQDVFLTLVQKLPKFEYDPGLRFRGWLWTVLANRIREKFRRDHPNQIGIAFPEATLVQPDAVPEWIDRDFRREVAGRALEIMQAEFHEPIWQACWQTVVLNRPADEVAAELGCTLDTVYRWRKRVLRRLRRELDGMMD